MTRENLEQLAKHLESIGMDAWTPKSTEELIELSYRLGVDPKHLAADELMREVIEAAREIAEMIGRLPNRKQGA